MVRYGDGTRVPNVLLSTGILLRTSVFLTVVWLQGPERYYATTCLVRAIPPEFVVSILLLPSLGYLLFRSFIPSILLLFNLGSRSFRMDGAHSWDLRRSSNIALDKFRLIQSLGKLP